jgi:hypothetical protein
LTPQASSRLQGMTPTPSLKFEITVSLFMAAYTSWLDF